MNIEKYSSYFHDASISDVNIFGAEIVITMNSTQLEEDENEDGIPLGRYNEIRGRLHLINPKIILINSFICSFSDFKHKNGTVLDLEFLPNKILLNVIWRVKDKSDVFEKIEFESVHYYFENIPSLHFAHDSDFDADGRYIGPLDT